MAELSEPAPVEALRRSVDAQPTDNGTFASLRIPNFRLLLIGTTLSNAAMWIQQVTVGWLVFDITGSGAMLGTVNLVRSFATLSVLPFSGVAIDRLNPRTLVLALNVWLFLASLVLGAVLLAGGRELWYLFAFMFMGGLAQTFEVPLRQTLVFVLVPRHLTPNALALVQTGWGLMRSLGPAVGGVLILVFGPGGNFLVQSAAYCLIALNILRIRFPPKQASAAVGTSFFENLREGFRYVARERTTRTFLLLSWVLPLFIIPNFLALTPIYAKEEFDGGAEVLGLLMSAVGTGGIFGGLAAASLGSVDRRGLVQIGSLLLLSLSMIAFAFSPTLPLAWAFLALAGFFELIFLTGNQALLQLSIPDDIRGRVTSITSLSMILSPIGALYAGAAADVFGPATVTVALCGASALIAVGVYLFVPLVRDYRLSRALREDRAGLVLAE